MKQHRDHIKPKAEGGSEEDWNIRYIDASDNLQKGAEMPDLEDVLDSSDPIKLAVDIDMGSLKGFRHPRNDDRGFGGLRRR